MKYTASMILAGGLNSHANQLDKPAETPRHLQTTVVESWDGTKWVSKVVPLYPELQGAE